MTDSKPLLLQWLILYHFIIVFFGTCIYILYRIYQRINDFPFLTRRFVAFGIDGSQAAKKSFGELFVIILSCLGLNLLQERLGNITYMFNILCLLFDILLIYYYYIKGKYLYNLIYGSLVTKYYGSNELIKNLLIEFKKSQYKIYENEYKIHNKKQKEIVALDAGCGSGMITTFFAKLFYKEFGENNKENNNGNVFNGLKMLAADKWMSIEQSNSSETNVYYNLKTEGLLKGFNENEKGEKGFSFKVETCDLRDMPFEDGKFDMVMSSLVMHIIEQRKFDKKSKNERKKAVESLIRVLSPNNGILAIWDIIHAHEYLQVIKSHKCMKNVQCIPVTCSYTYYPHNYIIIAVKNGSD